MKLAALAGSPTGIPGEAVDDEGPVEQLIRANKVHTETGTREKIRSL